MTSSVGLKLHTEQPAVSHVVHVTPVVVMATGLRRGFIQRSSIGFAR